MVIEEEGNDKFETKESDAAAADDGDHAWSMRRQHLVMGI